MLDDEQYTNDEIFKLKRKWQIALRRYVLEQSPCPAYAKYFALPIELFREWIAVQFDNDTSWENFSINWQFDHILPLSYFDFKSDNDLRLCWNFTNIRVEKIKPNKNRSHRVDVIAAKAYFNDLYGRTGYELCIEMIQKIDAIVLSQMESTSQLESFISKYSGYLNDINDFSTYDFGRINQGMTLADFLIEREMLLKFGK